MCWHDKSDGTISNSPSDGTRGRGISDQLSNVGGCACLSIRNVTNCIPDRMLERCTGKREWHGKRISTPSEVLIDLCCAKVCDTAWALLPRERMLAENECCYRSAIALHRDAAVRGVIRVEDEVFCIDAHDWLPSLRWRCVRILLRDYTTKAPRCMVAPRKGRCVETCPDSAIAPIS